ncbi:MAG TPA: hypothetical protein VM324_15995 [Egibacteraceae bacterium]|nr:hypothetical protein [Egibacteraceae bacterium]
MDLTPVVLTPTRAEWAEQVGFPPELIAVGGAVLVVCGAMMWAGRWRRWLTANVPSAGRPPATASVLLPTPYVCIGFGLLLIVVGLYPRLSSLVNAAVSLAGFGCLFFALLGYVLVTPRNLERIFGRHPGGTRITRLFLVPWIHRFLEEHFSPHHQRLG